MILVSESTLQIEKERIDELDIKVVDYPVFVNGELFDAGYSMSPVKKEELRLIIKDKENKVTTSGLNYNDIKTVYDKYAGEQIVSMHQSFNNSRATAETLVTLKKDLADSHNIFLFDTNKIAAGLSVQVLEAAKAIKNGISLEDLKVLLEKNKQNTGHFGVLFDMFFLKRSGRIGFAKALLGSAMKVLPLVRDDQESGALKSVGKAKNYIQANQKFINIIENEMIQKESNKISVLLTYCGEHEKDCLHFKKLVEEKGWDASVEIHYTGPSNIPHEGPEFYEIGFIVL